jgi:hypothetical protein
MFPNGLKAQKREREQNAANREHEKEMKRRHTAVVPYVFPMCSLSKKAGEWLW